MTTQAATTTTTDTAAPPAPAALPVTPAAGTPPAAGAGGESAAPAAAATLLTPAAEAAPKTGAPAEGEKAQTPEAKAAADAAAAIDLKLPDGFTADETLDKFKGVAKELKLDSAGAQKLFDLFVERATSEAAEEKKMVAGWEKSLREDKEFAGTKGELFDGNLRLAQKAVAKFVDEPTRQFLQTSGIGNHPGLVRAFQKMAKAIGEDTVAGTGATPVVPDSKPKNRGEVLAGLYPSMHGGAPQQLPPGVKP